jgi:plastocyanin
MFDRVTKNALVALALGGLGLVLVAACGSPQRAALPPTKHTITMAAVEPKGGAQVEQEAFPQQVSLPSGGGYGLKAPDATGRWEVSAYRWEPSQIIVNQGDEVTLEVVGINGAEHPSTIEGYDVNFTVKRGAVSTVSFKADQAGVFKIVCSKHQKSMVGELIVLPRS